MYAAAREFRRAREICIYSGSFLFRDPEPPCTAEDRLDAYTFILRQYTRATNPKAVLEDDETEDP